MELVLEDGLERPPPEADEQRIVSTGGAHQPFAQLDLFARDAVDDQLGPGSAVQFDRDLVRAIEHQAAVEQHVRGYGGQYQATQPGRDNWPSGRKVVPRR